MEEKAVWGFVSSVGGGKKHHLAHRRARGDVFYPLKHLKY